MVNGVPPYSMHVVVGGGLDADIATAILHRKPVAIGTYGSSAYLVEDAEHPTYILFDRPGGEVKS
jgi:hypothetical protein